MIYRRLGNSGLQVSLLSLGSWVTFANQIDDHTARDLMALAYDRGVNLFDNSESYAHGESEKLMGRIIRELKWPRSSFLISSKVYWGDGGTKPNQSGLSRKHIMEACHASLIRFQVDYLDLYFCHRPDKNTPIEETVRTMNTLIQQGKILYWGTSEWSAQEIMEANMVARSQNLIGPLMEQPQYNMFYRSRVEVEYDQIYKTVGLGLTVYSPLASGSLTPKYIGRFPEGTRLGMEELQWLKDRALTEERLKVIRGLNSLALEIDSSLPKLSIAWCAKNQRVNSVILGASRVNQLDETLDSINTIEKITPEVESQIEQILQNKPKKPTF